LESLPGSVHTTPSNVCGLEEYNSRRKVLFIGIILILFSTITD